MFLEDGISLHISHFPLQFDDESTDVEGLSQLIVFDRYLWKEDVHEEMLFCEPIMRGTSDEIFDKLNFYIKAKTLCADFKNVLTTTIKMVNFVKTKPFSVSFIRKTL